MFVPVRKWGGGKSSIPAKQFNWVMLSTVPILLVTQKNVQYILFFYYYLENAQVTSLFKTRELWSSKAAFTIAFFAAVNLEEERIVSHDAPRFMLYIIIKGEDLTVLEQTDKRSY